MEGAMQRQRGVALVTADTGEERMKIKDRLRMEKVGWELREEIKKSGQKGRTGWAGDDEDRMRT